MLIASAPCARRSNRAEHPKHQCFTKLPTPFPCPLSIDCRPFSVPSQLDLSAPHLVESWSHQLWKVTVVATTTTSSSVHFALRLSPEFFLIPQQYQQCGATPLNYHDQKLRISGAQILKRRQEIGTSIRPKSGSHPLVRMKLCQHLVMSLCRSPLPPPTAAFIKYLLQADLLRTSDSSMRLFCVQPWCLRFPLRSRHLHTFKVGFLRQQSIPSMILASVLPLLVDPSTVVLNSLFNVACTQLHTCVCKVFGFNLTHVLAFIAA